MNPAEHKQMQRAAAATGSPAYPRLHRFLLRLAEWLREMGPSLLVSLAFHACVLVILAVVTIAVVGAARDDLDAEFNATLVAEGPFGAGGGFRFPGRALIDRPDSTGLADFPSSLAELDNLLEPSAELDLSGISIAPSQDNLELAPLGRSEVIGIGGGGRGMSSLGSGLGDADRAGGGPIHGLWGLGQGQRANLVVYILDRSGSMIESFDELRRELKRSIGRLQAGQRFNVLWFSSGPADELSPEPLYATPENKARAFASVDQIVAAGQTDPSDALRRGFTYRPDIVFFLTDACDFEPEVVDLVRSLHKRHGGRVHTIFYNYLGGAGEISRQSRELLRRIARENNGDFKEVTIDDIE